MKIGKYEIKLRSVRGISVYYLEDIERQCSSLCEFSFMTDAVLEALYRRY